MPKGFTEGGESGGDRHAYRIVVVLVGMTHRLSMVENGKGAMPPRP